MTTTSCPNLFCFNGIQYKAVFNEDKGCFKKVESECKCCKKIKN